MCKEDRCIVPLLISTILGILIGALFYTGTLAVSIIMTPIIFATVFAAVTLILLFVGATFATKKESKECICKYGGCIIFGGIGSLVADFLALTFFSSLASGNVLFAFLIGFAGLFFVFNLVSFVEILVCLVKGNCDKDYEDKVCCKFDNDYCNY